MPAVHAVGVRAPTARASRFAIKRIAVNCRALFAGSAMSVFNAIFPIIAIAACGYLARRCDWLSVVEAATVERLAFWFLIPCLLFIGTATAEFPADMDWQYLFAFYLAVALVYALGMLAGRLVFGYSLRTLSVFGMGAAYSNVTVLGIPLTLEVLGEAAFVPMFIIISIHNLLLFSVGTVLAELRSSMGADLRAHLWRVGREMLANPISGSLLAGAAWNFLKLPLPSPLQATLELLSQAAVPAALFALGAALTRYRIRGEIPAALVMVAMKLLVLPLCVWLMMTQVFNIDPLWMQTAVLLSCMPVGISVYVFSKRYECGETAAATAIVMSSLGAVLSITLATLLLQG